MDINILDLNDYCLGTVLKYHDLEDHVRFAQTCTRFREVLRDWAPVLYPDFKVKRTKDTDPETIKWEYELLCIIRDIIKRLYLDIHQVDGETSLSIDDLCTQIKSMESLEYIAINEGSILGKLSFNASSPRQQLIEKALDALEFLPNLKSVSVSSKTDIYSSCCLKRMKCLEKLSIDNTIGSKDLVEICKLNTNLRVLWVKKVVGELTDIVPHCQNLEEIAFPMFAGHKSYASLADLPKVRKIIIKSTNSTSPCAKLIELLDAFASKKHQTQLQSLILLSDLNFDETSKLIELTFLRELRCSFDDARCIDLLTDLTELEGLYIMLKRSAAGSKECLNVLRSCQKLQRLHIYSNLSTEFLGKALDVLKKVRIPEKQKPLELYLTGVMHLCNEDGEKLIDDAHCTLVNQSKHFRALPWRLPN
ncbi:uncharacterized protein LOC117788721 [Drosophila innubila]|uniref:uncharacterized protein LOC117788721 n=1 Tax=Drosophila innubila TaxID=198719 RepID=UPI00148E7BE6|nr:uncharacterized protein LOC117788721 [Drosophila innubila]